MYTIHSDRLCARIAEPGRENLTSRFNYAGFITSVVLDNRHEFCGDEHGGTKGVGLCAEITTDVLSEQVAVGEKFPKFGVGILEKYEDMPYDSQKFYKIDPFEFSAEPGADRVVFHTKPREFMGYALAETKTVSVRGNVLRVDYEVENVGSKEIDYAEYCHNFLTLDFDGVRNSYNLNIQAGNAEYPFRWRIHYSQSGLYINARDYFTPHHHNIWSPGFVISPEIYFKKLLKSGEKAVYAREWEFCAE